MTNTDKKDLHVKNGDRVIIIAGKDKGKIGNSGLIKLEAPIDSSNVMIVCPACDKATRPSMKVIDGKKVRICKKCGEQLDA